MSKYGESREILIEGSASCGKSFMLRKRAEYLREQGKKVFIVGENDSNE